MAAVVGLALAQLRHEREQSLLAICGIALAVLSMTVLAGAGLGALDFGEQQFESADRDLWITSGSLGVAGAGGGGFTGEIQDSRTTAAEIESHDDVRHAHPLGFDTVYVSADGDEFDTHVGVGVPGGGPSIEITEGEGFSDGDTHYANGTYEGPRTNEVIVDEQVAAAFDVGVGDTIYVGGSLAAARENEFTIVGISPTFSEFAGAPAVTVHLSELQAVTGTTGTDPATMITVSLEPDADAEAVQADLEREHPEYEVRTNRDQLESVLEEQAVVLAGAASLVALAIVAGVFLTANLLVLVVHQQRAELAALAAIGIPNRTIRVFIATQGSVIGVAGGLIAVLTTPAVVHAANVFVEWAVGYEGLVVVDHRVLLGGGALAVAIGTVAAVLAAARTTPTYETAFQDPF